MHCSKIQRDGFRYKETPMTSTIVYQHMSSHYRRILNAKPAVDTSTPQSFKIRQTRSAKPRRRGTSSPTTELSSVCRHDIFPVPANCSAEELQLIDRIVADDKFGPSDVCRFQWSSKRHSNGSVMNGNTLNTITNKLPKSRQSRPPLQMKKHGSGDLLERHQDKFEAFHMGFWPRILKSDVESRLRGMRVYHPPRRKTAFEKAQWDNESEREEERACGCRDECNCVVGTTEPLGKEPSQASSRDSAYNGGTSSTPDSRSPTPCQQKMRSSHVKHAATQTEPKAPKLVQPRKNSGIRGEADEFAYTKFIHDITMDVVEAGQFTDKSLTRIIKKHVAANLTILDKGRMLEEVSKLRQQLGMPLSSDDCPDCESTVTTKASTQLPRSLSYESSAAAADSDSWTTHYRQITKSRRASLWVASLDKSEENNVLTVASEKSVADTDQEADNDRDSDSSRETTIKEVEVTAKEAVRSSSGEFSIKEASWKLVEDNSDQDYLDESIEVGSSLCGDDFSE